MNRDTDRSFELAIHLVARLAVIREHSEGRLTTLAVIMVVVVVVTMVMIVVVVMVVTMPTHFQVAPLAVIMVMVMIVIAVVRVRVAVVVVVTVSSAHHFATLVIMVVMIRFRRPLAGMIMVVIMVVVMAVVVIMVVVVVMVMIMVVRPLVAVHMHMIMLIVVMPVMMMVSFVAVHMNVVVVVPIVMVAVMIVIPLVAMHVHMSVSVIVMKMVLDDLCHLVRIGAMRVQVEMLVSPAKVANVSTLGYLIGRGGIVFLDAGAKAKVRAVKYRADPGDAAGDTVGIMICEHRRDVLPHAGRIGSVILTPHHLLQSQPSDRLFPISLTCSALCLTCLAVGSAVELTAQSTAPAATACSLTMLTR